MRLKNNNFPCLRPAAFQNSKLRIIWALGLPYSPRSGLHRSKSDAAASMMWLTSTPGSMSISREGGPERRCYGP
jgi:hypothetical protein